MRTSRNFIDTQDLGPDVIRAQMDLIRLLKQADKQNACPRLLEGASLGMIFEEASTRTRVSFEVARRHRFAREMAELPAEVEAHVLPAGGTSTKDDNPLGFRDFSTVEHRIDASYAATADYLDDWVIPREDEDQRRPPGERRPDPE